MKSNSVSRRVLSLMVLVVMLFSCWVFTAPQADAANDTAAGTYQIKVSWRCENNHSYSSGYSYDNGRSNKHVGITVWYNANNGLGTESHSDHDCASEMGTKKDYSYTIDGVGFPTKFYIYNDGDWATDTGSCQVKKIEVRKNGTGNYTTLWSGNAYTNSNTNAKHVWVYSGGTHSESSDAGVDNGSWSWTFPYVSSGGGISCGNITLDGTNDKTATITKAVATDQYGVTYAASNCTLSLNTTPSYSSSYISVDNANCQLKATKNAHIGTEGVNSQDVSIKASWAGSSTITRTTTASITDETYNVAVSYQSNNTTNYDSPTTTSTNKSVSYGDKLSFDPGGYETNANAYTFKAWSPALAQVTGTGFSYTATYNSSAYKYAITFAKGSGNDFGTSYNLTDKAWTYKITSVPSPTKSQDNTNTYSFSGWKDEENASVASSGILNKKISELASIGAKSYNKQAKTYTAQFSSTPQQYTIYFKNGDGSTLSTLTKGYSETLSLPSSSSVTKASIPEYEFTFAGWTETLQEPNYNESGTSAAIVSISNSTKPSDIGLTYSNKTITYYPFFKAIRRSYNIQFVSADTSKPNDSTQTVTETKSTAYGSRPVPTTPATIDTDLWTRTFTKWQSGENEYTTAELPIVSTSGSAYSAPTYNALYNTVYYNYTITYKNGDGTDAATNPINYNGKLTLPGEGTVTKASIPEYEFTFVGWTETLQEPNYNESGTSAAIVSISNSTKPSDIGLSKTNRTKTYYPFFKATRRSYDIVFSYKNANNVTVSTTAQHLEYGQKPTAPTVPLTVVTTEVTFQFTGWSPAYTQGTTTVVGNQTYEAQYDPSATPHLITFQYINPENPKGEMAKSESNIPYGSSPVQPTVPDYEDEIGVHEFLNWSPSVVPVIGPAVYTAQYQVKSYTLYTVTFKNATNGADSVKTDYHYGDPIIVPTATKAADAQYTYTFDHWENLSGEEVTPAATVTQNVTYVAVFSHTVNQYTITYLKSDGTTYKVIENVPYGTVPANMTGEGAVPAMITKGPDAANHYTSAWDNDINVAIEGNTTFRIVDTGIPHTLDEGVVTKEETCTETGIIEKTCSVCNHHVQEVIPIDSTKHAWQRWENCDEEHISTLDNFVPVVFICANGCGNYCASTYNNGDGKYEPNENFTATTPTDSTLNGNSEKIPTPTFNNDCTEYFGNVEYNYNQRLASLRVRQSEINAPTQAMRFSGNLETYRFSEAAHGVDVYGCDPEKVFNSNDELMSLEEIRNNAANFDDNTVIDFGFVYTQARFIIKDGTTNVLDYDKMLLDNENNRIYRMSVVGNNKDNGTLSNDWQGFTDCANDMESSAGNDQFTFNLVININQKNYQAVYCARTYVVYKFRGDIIVMYDKPSEDYDGIMRYSHDSVFNQAEKNLAKQPPESIRNYLNYKIIDITKETIDDKENPRYVEQKNPDWNTAYKVKEEL